MTMAGAAHTTKSSRHEPSIQGKISGSVSTGGNSAPTTMPFEYATVPSPTRPGSQLRVSVGMPGCMMAMPKPVTIEAAYSVQTSIAAPRAAPASAAIVMPRISAGFAPMRAINSEPGTAAMANIASGTPIKSPICVSDIRRSWCTSGIIGGTTRSVIRMATPASHSRLRSLMRRPTVGLTAGLTA